MNFKDQWATDEEGNQFVFTVEMQRRLRDAGLPIEPAALRQIGASPDRHSASKSKQSRQKKTAAPAQKKMAGPTTIQIDPQTGKYIGRMKWYNAKKGYGFIVRGGGEEIFFHKSGVLMALEEMQEGLWILYDVEETHKGPEATDVEPYEGETDLLIDG